MDEKTQIIQVVYKLRNEAVNEMSKAKAQKDTYSYYLSMGKETAYTELLIEIEKIINPAP